MTQSTALSRRQPFANFGEHGVAEILGSVEARSRLHRRQTIEIERQQPRLLVSDILRIARISCISFDRPGQELEAARYGRETPASMRAARSAAEGFEIGISRVLEYVSTCALRRM